MKYRRLDENGDMIFGQGKYNYCEDLEAIGQAIKTKILLLKGEWWEDIEDGTPLFQKIFTQRSESGKNAVDIILKTRILEVEGVTNITSFKSEINVASRTYSSTISVETTSGTIDGYEVNL